MVAEQRDAVPASDPLQLHIPRPGSRPGEHANFGDLRLSPAGAVRRPAVDVRPEEMTDLALELIRALDDDGAAVGPWAGTLEPHQLIRGLRDMVTVRTFDARMLRAHRQGKISFYIQSLGEEAIACAHRRALQAGDMAFPTYRQQGLLIAADYPLVSMMDQVFSNSRDPMKGRQLPVLYSSKEYGFFSVSGNLATQYIQAVGWAMGSALSGDTKIASAWVGEGASAESDFHAALVFASTYSAPVVLNVVNNQWAISTFQGFARGTAPTFAARGAGFGIPALRVDGNDYLAVHAASSWAAERARQSLGPTLIEWVTYRAGAHSTSDDPTVYRSGEEVRAWPLGDPINRLQQHLTVAGSWDDARHEQMVAEVDAQVVAAMEEAESHGMVSSGLVTSPSTMFDDVYATMPAHLREQRQQAGY